MRKSAPTATPAVAITMPDGKLTRGEVARRLGVSRTTLRRLEGKSLHPVEGPGGVRFFEEREVKAFQITYRASRGGSSAAEAESAEGASAAEAFERFDQGASPVEVVKALRLAPDRVAALHDAWCRMKQPPQPASEGELAARAYEMFSAGKSCRDVAIELRQSAHVVLALHAGFAALNGADAADLPEDVLAKLREMGYRLPQRYPARAIPGLIHDIIESLTARIEQLDPEIIEARKAWGELHAQPAQPSGAPQRASKGGARNRS